MGSVIMNITGHKAMSMFEGYNTMDKDDVEETIKRLDEFLTKPSFIEVSILFKKTILGSSFFTRTSRESLYIK